MLSKVELIQWITCVDLWQTSCPVEESGRVDCLVEACLVYRCHGDGRNIRWHQTCWNVIIKYWVASYKNVPNGLSWCHTKALFCLQTFSDPWGVKNPWKVNGNPPLGRKEYTQFTVLIISSYYWYSNRKKSEQRHEWTGRSCGKCSFEYLSGY